jgi:hypothetical protein
MTAPELKRYACSETGGGEIIEWPNGEYVRFADVEAYTQVAIAAAVTRAEQAEATLKATLERGAKKQRCEWCGYALEAPCKSKGHAKQCEFY